MPIDHDGSPDFPRHWWVAEDGRAYSTERGTTLSIEDPAYTAWVEAGHVATLWPRDTAGAQTQAALDEVLAFYGVGPVSGAGIADVSSAQAKIMLSRAGYFGAAKSAVEAMGGEVEIWFSDARVWQRGNAYVAQIGEGLGLSGAEIDELFRQAAGISA